jgi:hypothetical protein
MANQEQLDVLKQGVEVWNEWRERNPDVQIDLRSAILVEVNFAHAVLSGADFTNAILIGVDFTGANLTNTNLTRAFIGGAMLKENLGEPFFISTIFGAVDLSTVKGLEMVHHVGPSTIGIDTIYLSEGKIPEVFLKRAGVPDSFIEYMRSLVNSPIDYYSCFLSYSSKDQAFAERLYADLQSKGVRCWFAPEDIKIGDKFRSRIDEAIRMYDKLLLVLSEHSIRSPWVEEEVEQAFEKGRKRKKLMLFPVQLDDAANRTRQPWASSLRRIRHIGDFRQWNDHDQYQKAFTRLLRDLKETS